MTLRESKEKNKKMSVSARLLMMDNDGWGGSSMWEKDNTGRRFVDDEEFVE